MSSKIYLRREQKMENSLSMRKRQKMEAWK